MPATVSAILMLLVLPALAEGHLTKLSFTSPFTGLQSYTGDSTSLYGCGNNSSTAAPFAFNNSSGFLNGRLSVSMTPTSACPKGGGGTAWRYLDLYLLSPNVTVAKGGLYVLRDVWWFNWFFNYTMKIAPNPSHQQAQANGEIVLWMWVNDLSTNTSTPQTLVYTSSPGASNVNVTGSAHEATWISLPIVTALTRGQTYQLVTYMWVQFVAASGPYPNSAVASLDLGTAGRGMALRAITVK